MDRHPVDRHPGDGHPGDRHPGDGHPGESHAVERHPGEEGEVPLWGDPGAKHQTPKASRRGDTVLRTAGPWSPTVIGFLRHLEEQGFPGAPRVVGTGFADDGREMLTYVPGESPHPYAWSDEAVESIGRMLRHLHAASAGFVVGPDACWQPWFGRDLPGHHPVIGHCDIGPWNVIARGGRPVAFVDWEFAGPVDAVWELAHAAWLNVQLHDDDLADKLGLPSAAARARQLRLIVDGYGLAHDLRPDFVDKMIAFAVHAARADAVDYGVDEDTTDAVAPDGYPVLWGITWRTRDASWMLRHRALLTDALL
jgi:hypothetical protein